MRRWMLPIALSLFATTAAAQSFDLPPAAILDDKALAASMPALAVKVGDVVDTERVPHLDAQFRLQMVEAHYDAASRTLDALLAQRANDPSPGVRAKDVQYAVFLRAKALQATKSEPFDAAFRDAFREIIGRLDDRTSALVVRAMTPYSTGISLHPPIEENLAADLRRQMGKTDIALPDALKLLHDYQVAELYRQMAPLTPDLIAEDDQNRYLVEQLRVPVAKDATVCALIVRPRASKAPLPTLMEFTIYADPRVNLSEARRAASNGYVGVEGTSRGKLCSDGPIVPEEHEGADSAALVDWIARQPWSDGRVGMFGGSYDGFTQWATAKHHPKALKAMMPAVTEAPGIDSPNEGGVVQSFGYYWPFYVTNNRTLDDQAFADQERYNGLFRQWYKTGGAYRDVGKTEAPNPIWQKYLDHPDYDAYRQAEIPFGKDFAGIDIPVLTTTGYYDGGEVGALYYFTEHYRHNPKAEHYLVIGPYDHHTGNRGTVNVLGDTDDEVYGYKPDPAADIDLGELRFQWFDYVFKGGPKPAILKDRVNYEVMGANAWEHASSIAAMGKPITFHLASRTTGDDHSLVSGEGSATDQVELTQDLADRTDADRQSPASGDILDSVLDTYGSIVFESAPLETDEQLSGLFSGHLSFETNKRDFDFQISLYEVTPDNKYFQLSFYLQRASYAGDLTRRQLLTPGKREILDFTAGRMISRQFRKGSRLLVQISTVKGPFAQINYGSGKPVSDETIKDAGAPLSVHFFGDSTITVPFSP